MNLDKLSGKIYEANKAKGFWPKNRKPAECIALMHSELSEMLEMIRKNVPMVAFKKIGKSEVLVPCGVNEEIADTIIRLLDFCGRYKIDIEQSIRFKLRYNKRRPYKHGKNF